MKQIKFTRFTITENEVREVVEEIGKHNFSDEKIQSILTIVECDPMLWKDIRNSIIRAIHYDLQQK